jgi:serine/threonine protein kinase
MKKVLVKVVDRRHLLQSVDVAALQDEITLREPVTCPQIIQLYEIFEESDTTFLVMELLKGGNLIESITQQAHYTEADAKALFRNILLGVQFIHSKSIANRNLKPETLLLSTKEKNADVKISDFGYAKK